MVRTVRTYDDDFKTNAVSLYYSNEKSLEELSKDLGISNSTLYGWVRNPKINKRRTDSPTKPSAELKELQALKKELSIVKEERDILKKALSIFSNR